MATLSPRTCTLSSRTYLIHPQVLGTIAESVREDAVIPVTLLTEDDITSENLDTILKLMVDADDVLSSDFTQTLVAKPENAQSIVNAATSHAVHALGNNDGDSDGDGKNDGKIPLSELRSGPYFIVGRSLHQAWRLYEDDLSAFTYGTLPNTIIETPTFFTQTTLIPVPSRHYYPEPSPERPLSGVRLSLKDVMDVTGTITTLSSRAYTTLQTPATSMADFVTDLLNKGAVVVGKSKTYQMIYSRGWVDTQRPFNPRGDGYQTLAGSSSGAVAGLAGYEWLDGAVGGDTAGGIRSPASWTGLYAIRPTFGCSSSRGVRAVGPAFDTLCPASRSFASLYNLTRNLLTVPPDTDILPTRILLPIDIFPTASPRHKRLTELFVECLESYLGVKHSKIDLAELWSRTADEGGEEGLHSFIAKAPTGQLLRDYYHVYEPFRAAYRAKFNKEPYIGAEVKKVWEAGKEVTDTEYAEHVRRNAVVKAWWEKHVMPDEKTIMIAPFGTDHPRYTDDVPGVNIVLGLTPKLVASVLGAPQVVAPFAQVPYQSKVSQREEYRPISASLLGVPGSDLALIRIMEAAFEKAGWRTKADTGMWTFPLGKGERAVDDNA